MTIFTSSRERRLWFWTVVVVVAIYSTLGLTSILVDELVERGLFVNAFILGFFLIWVAVLTQGLKVRPRGLEVGVGLGVAAVYVMVFARMGIVERSHLFEYGVVAVLIHEALKERAGSGRGVLVPALLAVVHASLLGAVDELIQLFLPERVFDVRDILFNMLAAFMAVAGSAALTWARGRFAKGPPD